MMLHIQSVVLIATAVVIAVLMAHDALRGPVMWEDDDEEGNDDDA